MTPFTVIRTKRPVGWLWSRVGKASGAKLLAVIALVAVVSASCANGSYPLDFFYEMHYQQIFQSHEPPRLSPPASAVPVTGRDLPSTMNPIEGQRAEDGERLFQTNCVICHGIQGKGDGLVLQKFEEYGYLYAPDLSPDLTDTESAGSAARIPDDQVFAWITAGVSNGLMPSFSKLLTVEERWLLVNYIRTLQE